MTNEESTNQLFRILIQVIGRAAIPLATVQEVVGSGRKQITAFNLCDGTLTQSEVAQKTRIDQGQLSRTFTRWVQNGVAFWIGEGKEARLLHVFPIPSGSTKKAKRRVR